jgi:alkylation response protein AidB-like acyl-CoA dehydrogenase
MQLGFSPEQEIFRAEVADWLEQQLSGPFAHLRFHEDITEKITEWLQWEKALHGGGWSCISWPKEFGGREATLPEQVIFAEEYVRLGGPGRVNHIGTELCGPTILAFGSTEQKQRFLPPIARGEEMWCQGFSEPNAGSDLSNVRTKARLEHGPNGDEWVIDGQKIWTSFAQFADWGFVVCRTEEGSRGPQGLSYLLVPMHQPGITVRPIKTMVNDEHFCEVFFDGARTGKDNVIGEVGGGWKVTMGTLAFERGAATLGQQMSFWHELGQLIDAAAANGKYRDADIRQRIADAYIGLKIMRYSALRMLSNAQHGRMSLEGFTSKIYWASWHKRLGELAMDVLGAQGELVDAPGYRFRGLKSLFLNSRADTIYAGTNQIQRNIIAERALGLPREPRGK